MNKLEKLIAKLCPNGVEYKPLGEVVEIVRGDRVTKKQISDGGEYPVISGGTSPMGYYTAFNREPNTITIAQYGTAGFVDWQTRRFWANDVCYCLQIGNNINRRFLYYALKQKQDEIYKLKTNAIPACLPRERLAAVEIPLPPLAIQEEIVRMLDGMAGLISELEQELAARKQQYEWYERRLLTLENDVPAKALIDLCDYVDYRGKTPKKTESGIFLVTAKNIRDGYIDYEASKEFIASEDYAEAMHRGIPQIGDVLITTEAPCGNVAQVDKTDIALAQRVIKYRPKTNELNATFLKSYMRGKAFQDELSRLATGGTVKGIKGSKLHQMKIPLPPLAVQKEIVARLESFDKLCNSMTEGLPGEIALRKQQYEYYRDQLLNFRRAEHGSRDGERGSRDGERGFRERERVAG